MIAVKSIVLQASPQQMLDYQTQCDLTETLMAQTLATRLGVVKDEQSITAIRDWFRCVRMMAVTAHATSGMSIAVTPTDK